jgi:alkyl hydroperoxide reductase subunit D
MEQLEALRSALPESAKDVKLNVQAVLTGASPLSAAQRWGVAVTAAYASRNPTVRRAVVEAARAHVTPEVLDDAQAAAALMAMNNVFYRFRHMVEKPSYEAKRANLRMNRLVRPATSKVDFELFSLAASAINGCATCITAHEREVVSGGLSEDHVHDAVRIAATIQSFAVAQEIASDAAVASEQAA